MKTRTSDIGLVIVMLLLPTFVGCTKTIVETKEVDVHDTLRVRADGPAFVRFISMLPGHSTIVLSEIVNGTPTAFGGAFSYMMREYTPIQDSTPVSVICSYSVGMNSLTDTIQIPALNPFSLRTFALFLFQNPDNSQYFLKCKPADDSLKMVPPPPGTCYIRFINGVSDFPSPTAKVYMYVNSDTSFYKDPTSSVALPISYGDIQNYRAIRSGIDTVVFKDGTGTQLYPATITEFLPGQEYTLRITGRRTDANDAVSIDLE